MDRVQAKSTFSAERAHKTQFQLSEHIIFKDKLAKNIHFVAGVDVSYVKGISISAAAVLDYDSLKLVESQTASCRTSFPYIPTLLSFREIPPAILSIKRLKTQPDVFLIDGQGFAHPYRCGFASHLGLVIRRPTIGVAKSKLFGEIQRVEAEKDVALLKNEGEVIGVVLRTKSMGKPVYISVGHMVSLQTAIRIVKHCIRDNYIPAPILRAHEIADAEKRKVNIGREVNG